MLIFSLFPGIFQAVPHRRQKHLPETENAELIFHLRLCGLQHLLTILVIRLLIRHAGQPFGIMHPGIVRRVKRPLPSAAGYMRCKGVAKRGSVYLSKGRQARAGLLGHNGPHAACGAGGLGPRLLLREKYTPALRRGSGAALLHAKLAGVYAAVPGGKLLLGFLHLSRLLGRLLFLF